MDVDSSTSQWQRSTMETDQTVTETRHTSMEVEATATHTVSVELAHEATQVVAAPRVPFVTATMSIEEDEILVNKERGPALQTTESGSFATSDPEADAGSDTAAAEAAKTEAGAFWDIFASSEQEGGTAALIRKGSFALSELLDEDDVLEELGGSPVLLDFLLRREIFSELVLLIITEGASLRHRFVACQILCFHLVPIGDAFFRDDGAHLMDMVSALERPQPLPVLSTEYCARVLVRLLQTHHPEMLGVFQAKRSTLICLCRNVGRPGCANVLAALVEANCVLVTEEPPSSNNASTGSNGAAGNGLAQKAVRRLQPEVAQWLASTGMIVELIRALLPGLDNDAPANAVASVGMFLSVIPSNSPLVAEISGPVALTLVLEALQYFEREPSSFRAGVDLSVMIMCSKVFDKTVISAFAPEVWRAVEQHVERLSGTTPRLSGSKYELVQLCSALALIGDPNVDVGLSEIHLPRIFANLVSQFPKNNMLHSACTHFFSASLKGALQALILSDDVAGVFIGRLAYVFDEWPVVPDRGFLLQFCLELLSLGETSSSVSEYLRGNSDWTMDFVQKLQSVSILHKTNLCGIEPAASMRLSAPTSVAKLMPFGNARLADAANSPSIMRADFAAKASDEGDGDDSLFLSPPLTDFVEEEGKAVSAIETPSNADGSDEDVVFGDFPQPSGNAEVSGAVAPAEEALKSAAVEQRENARESFSGDGASEVQSEQAAVSFGEFGEPEKEHPPASFGAFAEAEEQPAFGGFDEVKSEEPAPSFGAFVEASNEQPAVFGAFDEVKDEQLAAVSEQPAASFGAFVEATEQPAASFGAFSEAISEEPSFGDFAASDVSFAEFADTPAVEFAAFGDAPVSFGAFEEAKPEPEAVAVAAPAVPVAAPAAGSWAAFEEEKHVAHASSDGSQEAAQLRAVFRKIFASFPAAKEKPESLCGRDLSVLTGLKQQEPGAVVLGAAISQALLMNTLKIVEPPPPAVVLVAAVSNLPTPPPVRLSPPPLESPTLPRAPMDSGFPSAETAPFGAVVAPVADARLSVDDFGFLSTMGAGILTQKKPTASTSNSLDFLFGGTSAPAPVLSPEQARDAAVAELISGLSDLSFMLSETLSLPAKQQSLLSFF